jgi:hypothetical protein
VPKGLSLAQNAAFNSNDRLSLTIALCFPLDFDKKIFFRSGRGIQPAGPLTIGA